MKVIRFKAYGVFNSFRVPLFRTYHKSFLAPPKTTIIGMLANIMAVPEKWYYDVLSENIINVSVVIDEICGKAKDLWAYKTFESKSGMHGRSVIRRDKLFKASYTVYLDINDEAIFNLILKALKSPSAVPSLGLDDEIVAIKDVEEIEMKQDEENIINSVFMDREYKYRVIPADGTKPIELPTSNLVPLKFEAVEGSKNKRGWRKPLDETRQVEYINCEVEIDEVDCFTDGINRVVFY
jgi:CRISPR-associated Cas5-like protein